MLRSKYFWIAVVILVPFFIIWIAYGLVWAVAMLTGLAVFSILVFGGRSRRRTGRRYIVYETDDDEDYEDDDQEVIVERRSRQQESDRIRDLYLPKGLRNIHQEGLDANRRRQEKAMNESFRRFREMK